MPLHVHIADPADFIAAVPAMLGFTPVRSLVLIFVRDETRWGGAPTVQFLVRTESPLQTHRLSDTDVGQRAKDMCAQGEASTVVAVLVDDRLSRPTELAAADESCRSTLASLRRDLEADGLAFAGAWSTPIIAAEAEWWNELAPDQHGRLRDPASSQIAAEYTVAGRPIRPNRTAITDLVEVDPTLRERVTHALPEVAADAQRRFARAVRIGNPDAYTRQALWRVVQIIKHSSAVETPAPRNLAEVAVALRDTDVREVMYGIAAGPYSARAHQLWSILTRALPDPDRADAAMLLGFSAYLRGDGALAGIALEAALASDPDHRMAQLLDLALSTASPPSRLRRLCRLGIDAAAQLRIDIGGAEPDSPTKEDPDDRSR
ncbi:DUF4192 family protein [Nocardia sp. SYP-A9097]|uniref:DUF4192 domain-containing protein n=1 Tax=Nocardia sp. SYP-A9097 TaxID=2663237 RepID=UPI00129B594B|nr:DUF4192 domain-containing protein [Nocardia sp. SYP-A9097]MRH93048.1 DUF4192 family protein [Nocardia sp. SYP-A9097]